MSLPCGSNPLRRFLPDSSGPRSNRIRALLSLWVACVVSGSPLGWGADSAAPAAERRPDAAEAVQEGNVEQWLQHYQRERGPEWERASTRDTARSDSPATPSDGTRSDSSSAPAQD